MQLRTRLAGALALAIAINATVGLAQVEPVGRAEPIEQIDQAVRQATIRVLELSGSATERGERHGRELRDEIRALVARWQADLEQTFGVEPRQFIRRFVENTDFQPAIEKWTPGLLDEVRGIATGAGLDFETIYVFNLIDEVWAQGRRAVAEKCTSIGVGRDGSRPTIVAQNLDFPLLYHGVPVLLRISDDSGLQTLVVTLPGLLAANGINNARIGVAVNTLLQLRPRRDGLPVAFVVRGVLQRKTWRDARKFLYDIEHASGQNYILGGPELAHSFECSAGRVVRCVPFRGGRRTWHTNHPLLSEDWHPEHVRRAAQQGVTPQQALRPCPRLEVLEQRLGDGHAVVDEAAVVAALSSKDGEEPICNPSTFVSTLMLLGRTPRLRICPGRPSDHRFVDFCFAKPGRLGKPGGASKLSETKK